MNWRPSNMYTTNLSFLREFRTNCFNVFLCKYVRFVYIWQEKANRVDGWVRGKKLQSVWVDYRSLILYKSAELNFRQLCSINTFQPHWTFSTVSALNWNLWDIFRTSSCTIFMFAFGVSIQLRSPLCDRLCKNYVSAVAFYFLPE